MGTQTRPAGFFGVPVQQAAALDPTRVLQTVGSRAGGLTSAEVNIRRDHVGPNAVRSHHARALAVLGRQLCSALFLLLLLTAVISFFLGDRTDAIIIATILLASAGLGFVNEYRAENTAESLHSRLRHWVVVLRDGAPAQVDVVDLVPGDVVRLELGGVVPADLRLLDCIGFECDESVLTGETTAAEKAVPAVAQDSALADLTSCALMGSIVQAGTATGVVVATGGRAEFGRIALGLGDRQPETDFQAGLRSFSMLLLQVAVTLTSLIVVINLLLHRPFLEALLFSLAIAVGITPQLLPAVVSTSLAAGSRRLASRKVLVKRLVCIEDLGDVDVLITDKTGTLTDGRISLIGGFGPDGAPADSVVTLALLATEGDIADPTRIGGNALDSALWQAPAATARVAPFRRVAVLPFDYDRRMSSAVVQPANGSQLLIVKGAPESVFARCTSVPATAQDVLAAQFADGGRVVALATRTVTSGTTPTVADERDLTLAGFVVFRDQPKPDAEAALSTLRALGITVKIATGDNPLVAQKVCANLGVPGATALTGTQIDQMTDEELAAAAAGTTVFARVSPEQKARMVRAGSPVSFSGRLPSR